MSDQHIQKSIIQAIDIIANKRVSQASFDKTIKAVVKEQKDKATGEYLIKYQDSEFSAYATNSDKSYKNGQEVYVLIPGNDWDRIKTIIGSSNSKATTFVEVPIPGQNYNKVGTNLISLNGQGLLISYEKKEPTDLEGVSIDNKAALRYISQSDSIALGMMVKTALASSQVGGMYGIIANLKFRNDDIIYEDEKDSEGNIIKTKEEKQLENAIIRPYMVSSRDVIGNPYALPGWTYVQTLIKDINIDQFLGIDSVQIFCDGFPLDAEKAEKARKEGRYDIQISDIYLFGAQALTQEDLNGYTIHIDYSSRGNILYNRDSQGGSSKDYLEVTAELKVKGRVVTKDVQYFWFRENGTIFRGNPKYSARAGEGWECLNRYAGSSPVPLQTSSFIFNGSNQDSPGVSAALKQKVNKIRCVVVYQNNTFTGDCILYNHNLYQVIITSSDLIDGQNKTVYYLNNGSPTLTCQPLNWDGTVYNANNLIYTWYKYPYHGKAELLPNRLTLEDQEKRINLAKVRQQYYQAEEAFSKVATDSFNQQVYLQKHPEYLQKKQKYLSYNNSFIINDNICYNFPISSIVLSTKLSCVVTNTDNQYIGTGSITLQNRLQFSGMYSLSIDNGTKVFQYDNKGNSPASNQLEKPLEILPLTFTLIDDKGKEIPFEQIVNNGYVKWLIPKINTLLISKQDKERKKFPQEKDQLIAVGQDREFLDQGYDIYQNIASFQYQIKTNYDKKLTNNDIRLNIKYKDNILDAYTDFTFPKDGDPGTNGTDFIAKLGVSGTDRIYVSNLSNTTGYDDNGSIVGENGKPIEFHFYNNSNEVQLPERAKIIWSCPPKKTQSYYKNNVSYLDIHSQNGYFININDFSSLGTNPTVEEILNRIKQEKPINIIRATYKKPVDIIKETYELKEMKYYAEYPVCYSYSPSKTYRFKIKPKTGFKYVVYSQDGTRPDYDNTLPFELIVEQQISGYWIRTIEDTFSYTWQAIGDFLEKEQTPTDVPYKAWFKPIDNFDGQELYSAIVCSVKKGTTDIGLIHVPIYMILNRYGHQALNDWDGNSIQLNGSGNTILAPQIGAGKKEDDNSFTGVFMGTIQGMEDNPNDSDDPTNQSNKDKERGIESDPYKIGFAGYHKGARTIFLDSKTGKAQFGKNNAGRIILDPSQKINEEDAALIYSGNYPIDQFIVTPNVESVGSQVDSDGERKNNGMIIDLSTPQIGFGSGNFTVTKEGYITARGGGHIAGWSILDDQLHYHNEVGMASKGKEIPSNIKDYYGPGLDVNKYAPKNNKFEDEQGNTINDTIAFWAGGSPIEDIKNKDNNKTFPENLTDANFYATHGGYIYGKLGQIAGWNFTDDKAFYHKYKEEDKDIYYEVGMNADPTNQNYKPTDGGTLSKAFFANGNNFYVTHDGYLRSTSGKIATWNISKTALTDGTTGMGHLKLDQEKNKTNQYFGESPISARFWSNDPETNATVFAVDSSGKLYSRAGKIGGWTIGDNSLSAKGISIDSTGSISAGGWANKNSKSGWGITSDGNAYFNSGTIGTVIMDSQGISGSGGAWHIWNGDILLPWLKVDEKNYITYNNSSSNAGGGISNSGNTAGINSNGSYATPGTFKTSKDSNSGTWAQYIVDLIVDNLFVDGNFQVLKNAKVTKKDDGTASITGGTKVIYWDNKNLQCGEEMNFLNGFKVETGITANNKTGLTGTLKFSDDSELYFNYGIFTGHKLQSEIDYYSSGGSGGGKG